jgi:hypothetical protein
MLGICQQKHQQFTEIVNAFRGYEPTLDEVDTVCKRLFASSDRVKETSTYRQSRDGVLRFFRDGEANAAAGDTTSAWALYNGITEYADYGRPERKGMESADAKLDRNWFGSSVSLKARAMTEIAQLVR